MSEGRLATTPDEARAAAEEIGGQVVVKAQVLTGGRGKAGGIKLAESPDDAREQGRADPRARHSRPRRAQALDRERVRHREGVLPLADVRPWRETAALHVHQGRRDRHRRGRRVHAGEARAPARRPVRGLPAVAGTAPRLRRRSRGPGRAEADPLDRREALRGVRGDRRDAHGDQPADRHPRRRGQGARLEVHGRRRGALPASGHRGDARPRRSAARGTRGAREGRHVREARRRGRDPRQRRRPRHVDARRDRARRRPTGELLRPRRRGRRGGRGRRARRDHRRSRR